MKHISQFLLLVLIFSELNAAEKISIRLGVLPFGTVNWELTALKKLGLIETDQYLLDIRPVANPQAGKIALLANSVDMIVSDWIWVSRQRSSGFDISFYPYSNTAGTLLVNKHSNIANLQDLKNKRLGIAGGELDKNWLLLVALAKKQNLDLDSSVEKIFAAPPLLSQQLLNNRLDAILTYWHFAARLEAQGFPQLLDGNKILQALGVATSVPPLGYVFKRQWANQNKIALIEFFNATARAKNSICTNENIWQQIIPLTKTKSSKTQTLLRKKYCMGLVTEGGEKQLKAAEKIYSLLKDISNKKLTGTAAVLVPGTFWFSNDQPSRE
jgi:NitT/TauT family transport system substrate-binding protein